MTNKTELTLDDFAAFMATCILGTEHYKFDLLYDISKIVKLLNENRGKHETPIYETFHFMLRSTGSDLIKSDDENYNIYLTRSTTVYKLTFCWNRDYFYNIPFCTKETIL